MKIVATIASQRSRIWNLRTVVEAIAPQVDHLHVHLNDLVRVPYWLDDFENTTYQLGPDLGAEGKLAEPPDRWVGMDPDEDCMRVTLDDDLIYPPDFIAELFYGLERHPDAIVSFHGKRLAVDRWPWARYWPDAFESRVRVLGGLPEDVRIHVPGTGCMAWRTDRVRLPGHWLYRNTADLQVGRWAALGSIPVWALCHPEGWVRHQPIDHSSTIWSQTYGQGSPQTVPLSIANNVEWPRLPA